MKKNLLFLFLLSISIMGMAQRTPSHPLDIPEGSTDIYSILDTWEPGTPPTGTDEFDDQFYISRVRPLKRIVDGDYQVNNTLDRERKMCLWVPLDDPSVKWKALPRYCFEGDNFSMWSYVDIHGNWTAPWMRVSAGISDVAHKNGVKVGCVLSIPWNASVSASAWNKYGKIFYRLFKKNNDGTFKNSMKLVKLMKYYGIDGLGCNSEFRTNETFMNDLIAFSKDCHTKAKEIDWEFQLHWYDGTNDSGGISFDSGLGYHNDGIFGTGQAPVSDMLFANYNWDNQILVKSVNHAQSLNRTSYDYYAGFDIQGRAFKNWHWDALLNNKISIGFWGAHAQSLLHQSATDDGSSDVAIQKAYLLKQELTFSGGNRNPGLTPAIRTDATLANADLKTFHGLATFLTAKSTIQQVPFVTRFSLGNGLFFNNQGKTTFDHKWYNLNTQDFLPTWRWWITDASDQVNESGLDGLIKADLVFEDAWFGGSCLKLHGKTDFSRVKLFKTKLTVRSDYTLSITYKVLNGNDPKAKIFVAKQGALTEYNSVLLPAGKQGKWYTHTVALSDFGLGADDVVSMIGVSFENTSEDHAVLLGELALRNPAHTFNAVAPTIKKVDILRGRHNQFDYKIYYASKDESNGVKTYNDEVDTWYFEIYFQEQGKEPKLLTATTSWAAYVIDAPLEIGGNRQGRFGVRAVSPDGNSGSEITWTAYQDIPYNDPIERVVIDKPVVKPNESFLLKYEDTMHAPAQKWEIKDPVTGNVLASAANKTEVSAQINKEGLYDLHLTDNNGNVTTTRGFVQITPEATGAIPQVLSLDADKTNATTDDTITLSYASKDGEGSVSRALRIQDPKMFMVPAKAQTGYAFSYALWFKVEKFSHDKQGTNLINKNTIADKWPHNNWGDLWVTIRPEWNAHPANEISFNVMGWTAHDIPNESMMSSGFSVTPGVWNHIVVTQSASRSQKMYFNGKLVAQDTQSPQATRREDMDDSRIKKSEPANIFIGGGGVYKAGFNGWIDEMQVWNKELTDEEVQQAMRGYTAGNIPEGLTAYYTFEEKNDDNTFPNLGSMKTLKGKVVTMANSGGENTGSASYEKQEADNSILGYPGITGSLEIKTTSTWQLPHTSTQSDAGKQISVKYTVAGTFDAGVSLTNAWGSNRLNKEAYIVVTKGAGIEDESIGFGCNLYPNPFTDMVYLQFEETGNYNINILNQQAQVLHRKNLIINSHSKKIDLFITAPAGSYIMQIIKDGKPYKVIKLIKK